MTGIFQVNGRKIFLNNQEHARDEASWEVVDLSASLTSKYHLPKIEEIAIKEVSKEFSFVEKINLFGQELKEFPWEFVEMLHWLFYDFGLLLDLRCNPFVLSLEDRVRIKRDYPCINILF